MKHGIYTTILTIAGSDPSGGAGIQADIRTASLFGLYPLSVITALTSQNTLGVREVFPVDTEIVHSQLSTILSDVSPDAVKIGMLPSAETVESVAETIHEFQLGRIVADPVLHATSGASLSGSRLANTADAMKNLLFPKADVVTPNIPEAEIFLGHRINDINDAMDACVEFAEAFHCKSVLLKGGHLYDNGCCTDIFFDSFSGTLMQMPHSLISTTNLHGTGCVLSSSIASLLALDKPLHQAVAVAGRFLNNAIKAGKDFSLGKGNGPVYLLP